MKYEIKRLKYGQSVFVPQTVAEAVLIREGKSVTTLDKAVSKKIDDVITDPNTSGLKTVRLGNNIDISHINTIDLQNAIMPVQIKFDNCGHIIGVLPLGKLAVNVNTERLTEIDGSTDKTLDFGDDFQNSNNNIIIRWNNYGDT